MLANRLTEDGAANVLLLEAGGPDWHPYIHIPLGMGRMHEYGMFDWGYETDPEPNLNGRCIEAMRGKVLGGSSSINVMAYTRGNPGDFNRWAQKGARGWSYADVVPYFRRCETGEPARTRGAAARIAWHRIRQDRRPALRSLARRRTGLRLPAHPGLQRQAAGRIWPRPVHHSVRPAFVHRQCVSQTGARTKKSYRCHQRAHDPRHARRHTRARVEYTQGGSTQSASASREVIMAAGAFNTPQLLMLSGMGQQERAPQLRH